MLKKHSNFLSLCSFQTELLVRGQTMWGSNKSTWFCLHELRVTACCCSRPCWWKGQISRQTTTFHFRLCVFFLCFQNIQTHLSLPRLTLGFFFIPNLDLMQLHWCRVKGFDRVLISETQPDLLPIVSSNYERKVSVAAACSLDDFHSCQRALAEDRSTAAEGFGNGDASRCLRWRRLQSGGASHEGRSQRGK